MLEVGLAEFSAFVSCEQWVELPVLHRLIEVVLALVTLEETVFLDEFFVCDVVEWSIKDDFLPFLDDGGGLI